jgi:DNA-binding SARP family transcriptional activator
MDGANRPPMTGGRFEMPGATGLCRARLLLPLDAVLSGRLGCVVAPAGSGKTTLMAQWASTVSSPVAWYRADRADVAPGRLLRRLQDALIRATVAPGPDRAAPVDTVEQLAAVVERAPSPVLLVIDDLHVLTETTAETDLERLLLLAPHRLRMLLGTRRMPAFNLAHREMPAPVSVTGDDLRFRSWEVERLFRDIYATPLRPDDAAALTRRTEGWPAALQLFHLSTAGRAPADRRRAVGALTGRSRYAQDYLSGQVLAGLPQSLRNFLRLTCVFDSLTGDRCDALLGGIDGQRTLLELERRQALTTSDDEGASFRYHEVLRRHLETALHEELGGAATRAWYCRAADLLESEGAVVEALRARCRGEDWDGARALLHEHGAELAEASASGWADLLPTWLTEGDPWVSLAEARRLLEDGRFAAADRMARRAEVQFADPVGRDLCRDLMQAAGIWLAGPTRPTPRWDDVLRAATRRDPASAAQLAHQLDGPLARVVEGAALLLAGDRPGAEALLRPCADDLGDDAHPAIASRLLLAAVPSLIDRRADAANVLEKIHLDAERLGMTWLARVTHGVAVCRGGERSDIENAHRVVADCEQRGDGWGAALIAAAAAIAELRAGRPNPAAYEDLANRFRLLDAGVLEVWARAGQALTATAEELPGATRDARSAETLARSCGSPGALAVAYAALGVGQHNRELLDLAASTARTAGLDCEPWTWLPARPEGVEVTAPATTVRRTSRPNTPRTDLSCFGRFRIRVDGVDPDLRAIRPRARSTLRLLAVHAGRPVHRELLADALWGDLDPAAGMHNLQVAISSLRGSLEPGVPGRSSRLLVRDGEAYVLMLSDDSDYDLHAFDAALRAAARAKLARSEDTAVAALQRAVDLYAGDVLPEDGPAEWVTEIRDRYRLRAAEAAASLADLELRRGNPGAAAVAASRSVHIERWRDASWRTLIRAYLQAGDRAAAERARLGYHEMLASLGVPTPR